HHPTTPPLYPLPLHDALPISPPKPPAKAATRRFFLFSILGSWMSLAWITFTASMVGMLLGTVRFLFPNVLSEPPSSFKAGDINGDRKSTRLNSSHVAISYAVF